MTALLVGTVLAVAALAFVIVPLFADTASEIRPADAGSADPGSANAAVEALREVEFDRETGKLSASDYAALKAEYTREAIAAMRAEREPSPGAADDPIEAVILQYRGRALACRRCGPRPEPDAVYCSSCGSYLAGRCARCDAEIDQTGARFCSACGHTLAA